MQALHERLEASTTAGLQAIPTLMGLAPPPNPAAAAVASTLTATNHPNIAALSQNPIALFQEFQKQLESAIKHVRTLRQTTDNLNYLRQHIHKLPRVDQDRVTSLEAQKQLEYRVLGEKIKQVNDLMSACRLSPLGNDANFMSVLEKQKLVLYNELEMLRQVSATSMPRGRPAAVGGAPPLSHAPAVLGNSSSVSGQPNRAIFTVNANPPNPHFHNQPTPPLGGGGTNQVNSQTPQGNSNEVSSTTPDPTTRS